MSDSHSGGTLWCHDVVLLSVHALSTNFTPFRGQLKDNAIVTARCRLVWSVASPAQKCTCQCTSAPAPAASNGCWHTSGTFIFRDANGGLSYRHPTTGVIGSDIPAYSPDGQIVSPLAPPDSSPVVLCPEVGGSWCYIMTQRWGLRRGFPLTIRRSYVR